jgi:hypothetical protein
MGEFKVATLIPGWVELAREPGRRDDDSKGQRAG